MCQRYVICPDSLDFCSARMQYPSFCVRVRFCCNVHMSYVARSCDEGRGNNRTMVCYFAKHPALLVRASMYMLSQSSTHLSGLLEIWAAAEGKSHSWRICTSMCIVRYTSQKNVTRLALLKAAVVNLHSRPALDGWRLLQHPAAIEVSLTGSSAKCFAPSLHRPTTDRCPPDI